MESVHGVPAGALISLSGFDIISIKGSDCENYLQGQVTVDVTRMRSEEVRLAAQCDAKGKMTTLGLLLKHDDGFWFVVHTSIAEQCMTQLRKYGVFAKVDFENITKQWTGLASYKGNATALSQEAEVSVALPGNNDITLHWSAANSETNSMDSEVQTAPLPFDALLAILICSGFPLLHASAENQFVPQMLNVQALAGIDFDKGCYLGQETVARTHYLGKNKRSLYTFYCDLEDQDLSELPGVDVGIERKLGENWRSAGTIVNVANWRDRLFISAVLPIDLESDTQLRIAGWDNLDLNSLPLPYILEQNTPSLKQRNRK